MVFKRACPTWGQGSCDAMLTDAYRECSTLLSENRPLFDDQFFMYISSKCNGKSFYQPNLTCTSHRKQSLQGTNIIRVFGLTSNSFCRSPEASLSTRYSCKVSRLGFFELKKEQTLSNFPSKKQKSLKLTSSSKSAGSGSVANEPIPSDCWKR